MRILHFSDPHIGLGVRRVPLRDWPGKRLAGGANLLRGRGRRFARATVKTRALVEFAGRVEADYAVCSGDLTALATEAEFKAASIVLSPMLKSGRLLVVPGNHDLYTRRDVAQDRFARHFGRGLVSDLPDLATDGAWPIVRLPTDGVAVIAVNSARPNRRPWRSSGRVPDAQVDGLRAVLADARLAGRFVFLVTHYAPCRADGTPDTREHGLDNVREVIAAASGVELGVWLCGHIHTAFRQRVEGFAGEVFCAGSATLKGREALWVFDSGAEGWSARRGRWSGEGYELEPE